MPSKNKSAPVIVKNLSHAAAHADLFKFDGAVFDEAVNLLKACFFQRVQFLGKGVLLCYDDESKTVYLADEVNNIAKLEMGELKRWACCQFCGVQGFVDGETPEFVKASICKECQAHSCILWKVDAFPQSSAFSRDSYPTFNILHICSPL